MNNETVNIVPQEFPISYINEARKAQMNEIKRLGINAIKSTLLQAPSDANGYTAIVHGSVATKTGEVENIGAAIPDDVNGSHHPQVLISKAYQNALSVAVGMLSVCSEQPSTTSVSYAERKSIPENAGEENIFSSPKRGNRNGDSKKKFNHSNTKPASERQINYIRKLAYENGKDDVDAVAYEISHKSISEISSNDANNIIKNLEQA